MATPLDVSQIEDHGRIVVRLDPNGTVRVERITAESEIVLNLVRGQGGGARAQFEVGDSIDVSGFPALLETFCRAANIHIDIDFRATKLTSSHVVLEDTGLALGMGLFEMLRERMMARGVNGAGSSIRTAEDFGIADVSAAVSVEGRKYVKVVSRRGMDAFRWHHVLGHFAFENVRTEDIDDFIDALAGGMKASFFINERTDRLNSSEFWEGAIRALGLAVSEAFDENPARKGLPPGVKATLL